MSRSAFPGSVSRVSRQEAGRGGEKNEGGARKRESRAARETIGRGGDIKANFSMFSERFYRKLLFYDLAQWFSTGGLRTLSRGATGPWTKKSLFWTWEFGKNSFRFG